jgi:hypothetical protein
MDLPGVLARLRFLEAPDGLGGTLGISHGLAAGPYTAVARITFPGLALVDTDRQTARVAAWAGFLRSYCTEDSRWPDSSTGTWPGPCRRRRPG